MRATRRLAAPLAALIFAAAPATAFAQNAGDEQYADPFGNSSQSGGGGGSSNSGSGGSSQSSGSTGSGVAGTQNQAQLQATPSTSGATPATSSQAAGSSGQLPRTGLDVGVVAALGAALLLGGLALRRRSADARR
ncbi:MAG TPA: LPXTG cell wall anchor domain-containing protein [Solirubrobacteraceae bacterium]|nr:LPXTG cell wall anchor domain-containing protein [Solirubrobacteraceae bacterium]